MEKHSVSIAGHKTSISLEQPFWDELVRISKAQNRSIAGLIGEIDVARIKAVPQRNLSSALRIYILDHIKGENNSSADEI